MTEASFASLGPRLLARKGGAKPAMRPQAAALPQEIAQATAANGDPLEDLGWNDMGADTPEQYDPQTGEYAEESSAEIVPISSRSDVKDETADLADTSQIKLQRQKKGQQKKSKKKLAKSAKRAAFTLRLDSDRHLKLRLASTMRGVSAQTLVTKALDAMLEEIEDLDALAARMRRN